MTKGKKERGEVWWLAHGHSSRSRQPSFAPPTARPVVSHSTYRFGWHRKKNCFITSDQHDLLSPFRTSEYPCDPEVALGILRRCAYKNVLNRFFANPYAKEDDAEIFSAAGHMFGITLKKCYLGSGYSCDAEANLHFYSPNGERQHIHFHNGMTASFRRNITGMKIAAIQKQMR